MEELRVIYHQSDIALHAEAFDITNRHVVRMSFSTKIVDCMDSGCAVMAICDENKQVEHCFRRNECAICIHKLSDIESTLQSILDNPSSLIAIQHKAFEVGRKNHLEKNITKELINDFIEVAKLNN